MPKIVWVSEDSRIEDSSLHRMVHDAKLYGWQFIFAENGEMVTVIWERGNVETFSRITDS